MTVEGNQSSFAICPDAYDLSGPRLYNKSNFRENPLDPARILRFAPKVKTSYADVEGDFSGAQEIFTNLAKFSIEIPDFTICEVTIDGKEYFVQDTERINGVAPVSLLREVARGKVDPRTKQYLAAGTSQLCSSLTRYLTDRVGSSRPFLSEIYRLEEQYLLVEDHMVLVDIDPIVETLDITQPSSQVIFLSHYLGDIAGMINSAELHLEVSFEQARNDVVRSILELGISLEALQKNSSTPLSILLEKYSKSKGTQWIDALAK